MHTRRTCMATPFDKAWVLLKQFKNPHDEEKDSFRDKYPDYDMKGLFNNPKRQPTEEGTYGAISPINHPLYGQQGYEGGMTPKEIMERENASFDPQMESQEGLEGYPQITHEPFIPTKDPPNPFSFQYGGGEPQRGSMTPMEMERMMRALEESQRGYPSDMVEGDESQLHDFDPPKGTFGEEPMGHDFDAGRPQTIPMSPRGSVRGRGERQAFDKPKKPDWWRTLSGE